MQNLAVYLIAAVLCFGVPLELYLRAEKELASRRRRDEAARRVRAFYGQEGI